MDISSQVFHVNWVHRIELRYRRVGSVVRGDPSQFSLVGVCFGWFAPAGVEID
jgi:hypothetical protein